MKTYLILASLLFLSACPAAGGLGGNSPSGSRSDSVDPNACGDLSNIDIGRRIYAFLDATVRMDREITRTEGLVRDTCVRMGRELGMSRELDGQTNAVCQAVAEKMRSELKVGLKADAQFVAEYQPAVCTVNADIAAQAAAECEARAKADVSVTCSGVCQGTCQGGCDGTCQGATNAGGECDGTCQGTCQGSCQGTCEGSAEVDADASCKASAEVRANVEAKCTEPTVNVTYEAGAVVDATAVERVVKAAKLGLPRLLSIHARMTGPVATAFQSWSAASSELAASSADTAQALGARAVCVAGQLQAAAQAVGGIRVSMSVSVEASVSVGGAAGANVQ